MTDDEGYEVIKDEFGNGYAEREDAFDNTFLALLDGEEYMLDSQKQKREFLKLVMNQLAYYRRTSEGYRIKLNQAQAIIGNL